MKLMKNNIRNNSLVLMMHYKFLTHQN